MIKPRTADMDRSRLQLILLIWQLAHPSVAAVRTHPEIQITNVLRQWRPYHDIVNPEITKNYRRIGYKNPVRIASDIHRSHVC